MRQSDTQAGSLPTVDTIDAADYSAANLAAHFSANYRSRNRPLRVRHAASDWPAIKLWTLEYLAETCKDAPTAVMMFGSGMPRMLYLPTTEALARIRRGEKIYISQSSIIEEPHASRPGSTVDLPMLAQDCGELSLLADKRGKSLQAFIGIDTYASMHFHPGKPRIRECIESIKVQLVGKKKAILFSPNTNLKPALLSAFNFSKISFEDWLSNSKGVLAQLTLARNFAAYECSLEPGDLLFIPAYWWHSFYGEGLSMSATYFWFDAEPEACPALPSSVNYRTTRTATRIRPALMWMQRMRYRLRSRRKAAPHPV